VYSLEELGWCDFFAQQVPDDSDLLPARVVEENRELYRVWCEPGEFLAELSGKLRHATTSRADLPAVGDWVLAQPRMRENRATIHGVLGRKGKFSRKTAGRRTDEQIVAANIDVLFLVSSLNRDFNPRRIERYLTLAWDSGARPVIVLNKADLCENAEGFRAEAEGAAMGSRVVLTSATRGDGLAELRAILRGNAGQSCTTAGSAWLLPA
jgi:ribosome biogenesis GTPase